ncbi:hypothetical protein GGR57DRAFT_515127 [Xylariaceae sp. FL1272]|nr:hypothetical protein GGR57DRAFT_515127 [Xylariaceae sp. FL1272]
MESASVYEKLRQLFFSQDGVDLAVVCKGGLKMMAHRTVIKLHSPSLSSMIEEAVDEKGRLISKLNLPDVDYDNFYMVLQFMYGGNYKDSENFGSYSTPSNVVFLTLEEIKEKLRTLPCEILELNAASELLPDENYEPDARDFYDLRDYHPEKFDREDDISYYVDDDDLGAEPSDSGNEEDDGGRSRSFQAHNLFDSLRVYNLAGRFGITPLMLIARDRFYRTAEKVLLHAPDDGGKSKPWLTHDQQRLYRAKLIKAVYDDFAQVCEEVYETVHASDPMRLIPTLLIAAGYNNDAFRENMRPLLEKYPDLALAVVECMRIPNAEDSTSNSIDEMKSESDKEVLDG